MLLKERRGRRRSILTRTGLKTETAIKLWSHPCVTFLQGPLRAGHWTALQRKKRTKKKKALTIFLHCCKSRRWCEITSCCYKPFGRGEGVGTWKMKQAVRKEGGNASVGEKWKKEVSPRCHRWSWLKGRDNLETCWWHQQLCCALRSFMPPSLSQTAELNKRATLHRTSITRPCFSHTGFHQVFTSAPL